MRRVSSRCDEGFNLFWRFVIFNPPRLSDWNVTADKHGQLGIWDARAPPDEEEDDGDVARENREGGKYWRLQLHWPANGNSSVSSIKLDPIDSHNVNMCNPLHPKCLADFDLLVIYQFL